MKVLYVTHFSPWEPKFGAAMRSFGILRGLNRRHDLHVALASDDPAEVRSFTEDEHPSFDELHLLHEPAGDSPAAGGKDRLRRSFSDLLGRLRPDAVWYFTKYSVRRTGLHPGFPSVLDLDDVPWRKMLLMAKYRQGSRRLVSLAKVVPSWFEDYRLAQRANAVVITNPEERKMLALRRPVIPVLNGFDFPAEMAFAPRPQKRLLFFGSLFYYPNLDGIRWFCHATWPQVLEAVPGAQLDVAGLYDKSLVDLGETPGVKLLGFVDDLDACIAASAGLIVPLRVGSGTRIKIIEAWAKGLPVVATALGAEGLEARDGENALVAGGAGRADLAQQLARACIRLLRSPELGLSLAQNGFEHGKARFSWESIYPRLEDVLEAAAGQGEAHIQAGTG